MDKRVLLPLGGIDQAQKEYHFEFGFEMKKFIESKQ